MVSPVYILITAYKSEQFIEKCLNSVYAQKTSLKLNVIVGIDGCDQVLEKMQEIKGKYPNLMVIYYPKNEGPYITFNSLLKHVPENAIVQRFDSDDVMQPRMIQTMYENFPCYSKFSGISMLPKSLYTALGGFRPWRCAGDTEFRNRASKMIHIKPLPELFYRTQHENQLTKSKRYGFKSTIRNEYARIIEQTRGLEPFKIKTVCHEQERILE